MTDIVKTILHRKGMTSELEKRITSKNERNEKAVYESSLIEYGGVRLVFEGDTYAALFPNGEFPDELMLEHNLKDISSGIKITPYKK